MPEPPPSRDPPDPLAPVHGMGLRGLLEMLERLDGREEAQVARSALAGGVPEVVVLDELRREVERRILRTQAFYDRTQW